MRKVIPFPNPKVEPYVACSCGKSFTLKEWEALELVGIQLSASEDGTALFLECRNCQVCRTTRAKEITVGAMVMVLNATAKRLREIERLRAAAIDIERARCLSAVRRVSARVLMHRDSSAPMTADHEHCQEVLRILDEVCTGIVSL